MNTVKSVVLVILIVGVLVMLFLALKLSMGMDLTTALEDMVSLVVTSAVLATIAAGVYLWAESRTGEDESDG